MALVATDEKNLECLDMLGNSRVAVIVHSLIANGLFVKAQAQANAEGGVIWQPCGEGATPIGHSLSFWRGKERVVGYACDGTCTCPLAPSSIKNNHDYYQLHHHQPLPPSFTSTLPLLSQQND